ncbi:MAG: nucleotidyltransferase domain-containing protein [Bacteroidetes bacterium]|nr:nucleotidyltransferase domain-containing protein [Bacteroidota bacterium]MBU2585729.1 nucleotidyltransferase domain-containing protein [Bacteroidota bacterium]
MIFHNSFDEIFSSRSNIAVLRVLQDTAISKTGREIARLTGISPKTCLISLTSLENFSIVKRQRGGRDHLFSLNREHLLVSEGILPILSLERDFLKCLNKFISDKLNKYSESIILFGSVSRKEETTQSDLDLCLIYSSENEKIKLEETINKISKEVHNKFGANIAPFYISQTEFKKRALNKKPPVSEIIKEGIVLKGSSIKELING